MQEHLWQLVIGAYLFAAAGYAWAWTLYRGLSHKLDTLWQQVMNHHKHELKDLRERMEKLEQRL